MRKLIYISTLTAFFVLLVCSAVYAQINLQSIFERVDNPFQIQKNGYPGTPDQRFRSGAFIGTNSGGIELTYHPEGKSVFGSVHAGAMYNPGKRIPDARQMRFGGFTIGYTRSMNIGNTGSQVNVDSGMNRSNRDGMQVYFRIGPGMNVHTVQRMNFSTGEQTSHLYPGIHTTGLIGVSRQLSDSVSLFVEMGGSASLNPGLPEREWNGRPYLAIGIAAGNFW